MAQTVRCAAVTSSVEGQENPKHGDPNRPTLHHGPLHAVTRRHTPTGTQVIPHSAIPGVRNENPEPRRPESETASVTAAATRDPTTAEGQHGSNDFGVRVLDHHATAHNGIPFPHHAVQQHSIATSEARQHVPSAVSARP